MKKLKPSSREKKRYLLLEGEVGREEIEKIILEHLGVLGHAKASPKVIKTGNKIILAINREELNNVRAAFLLSGKKVKIAKVSGSLKKLK